MSETKTDSKQKFLLFDGRYHTDPDRAICHCMEDSLEEAIEYRDEAFPDAVIVRHDIDEKEECHLINPVVVA